MRSLYGLSYSCLWVSPQTLPRPAGFVYFYTPPDGIFTHFSLTVPCIHIGYARHFPGRPYSRRMHQWVEARLPGQPPSPPDKHLSMHPATPDWDTGWVASPAFAPSQGYPLAWRARCIPCILPHFLAYSFLSNFFLFLVLFCLFKLFWYFLIFTIFLYAQARLKIFSYFTSLLCFVLDLKDLFCLLRLDFSKLFWKLFCFFLFFF